MKTYRILGILWLALCCYYAFNLIRVLLAFHPIAAGLWVAWSVLAGSCLLYFVGIVASIYLFRGARWARWIIAVIAVYRVFGNITFVVTLKTLPIWTATSVVIALVSLGLLFLPRHEPVA
jgi:hypothetical protein